VTVDSSPTLLVLRALRIKGVVGDESLKAVTGLAPEAVGACVAELSRSGLAIRRTGRFGGWALTGPGRERGEAELRAELSTVGRGDEVRGVYDRFVPLNDTFKSVCTAWQVRDLDHQVLNDHQDAAYDEGILRRLAGVHDTTMPMVEELSGILSRFELYGVRLRDALRRVQAGDVSAFTRPMSDSYHDVWMELHEDLLLTLGLGRDAPSA
jgi:hypothetical protein